MRALLFRVLGVGVVSPRVTPLRQKALGTAAADATMLNKGLTTVSGFGIDRAADFLTGMGNYAVTPQEENLS